MNKRRFNVFKYICIYIHTEIFTYIKIYLHTYMYIYIYTFTLRNIFIYIIFQGDSEWTIITTADVVKDGSRYIPPHR
jgi:hypothetical protein